MACHARCLIAQVRDRTTRCWMSSRTSTAASTSSPTATTSVGSTRPSGPRWRRLMTPVRSPEVDQHLLGIDADDPAGDQLTGGETVERRFRRGLTAGRAAPREPGRRRNRRRRRQRRGWRSRRCGCRGGRTRTALGPSRRRPAGGWCGRPGAGCRVRLGGGCRVRLGGCRRWSVVGVGLGWGFLGSRRGQCVSGWWLGAGLGGCGWSPGAGFRSCGRGWWVGARLEGCGWWLGAGLGWCGWRSGSSRLARPWRLEVRRRCRGVGRWRLGPRAPPPARWARRPVRRSTPGRRPLPRGSGCSGGFRPDPRRGPRAVGAYCRPNHGVGRRAVPARPGGCPRQRGPAAGRPPLVGPCRPAPRAVRAHELGPENSSRTGETQPDAGRWTGRNQLPAWECRRAGPHMAAGYGEHEGR